MNILNPPHSFPLPEEERWRRTHARATARPQWEQPPNSSRDYKQTWQIKGAWARVGNRSSFDNHVTLSRVFGVFKIVLEWGFERYHCHLCGCNGYWAASQFVRKKSDLWDGQWPKSQKCQTFQRGYLWEYNLGYSFKKLGFIILPMANQKN